MSKSSLSGVDFSPIIATQQIGIASDIASDVRRPSDELPANKDSNCLAERVALIGINSGQVVWESTHWAMDEATSGRVVLAG
jgi:hypothetical protein